MIAGTGSALDEGIKGLLMREPELKVGIATYTDPVTFLRDMTKARPDVIVLNEVVPRDWFRTCELLREISPKKVLRVIVIRSDENFLEVYDKQCLKVTHNDDLIGLITHR